MIRVIHRQKSQRMHIKVWWAIILFLACNYLTFLAFMNICFENLVSHPPIWLLSLVLCIMVLDLGFYVFQVRNFFTFQNLLDLLVIISAAFSFSLVHLVPKIVYLQVLIVLKLKDVFYFNMLCHNLVKNKPLFFKIYVVGKIVYWIILVGHILGCFFYGLDLYLIKKEYFEDIAQNPGDYYQGSLHAYSPIFGLSEQWRYVYAIYYSYSLLSTVAFGDIVGKNYLQDVLVSLFLIMATIGIALIIEQMYIVFRRQKTKHYELTSKAKYLSEYLKDHSAIQRQFRYQLMHYMLYAQWQEIISYPSLQHLTPKLKRSLFSESILSRTQNQLPLIIRSHFLSLLKSKIHPAKYLLLDYNQISNRLSGNILIDSSVKTGYTNIQRGNRIHNKKVISFGFQDLILGTNYLNRGLVVELSEQAQVFVLSESDFRQQIKRLRFIGNEHLPSPIQQYQISRDQVLNGPSAPKMCPYCGKNHSLAQCPQVHYSSTQSRKQLYMKFFYQPRHSSKRKRISSKRIHFTSEKSHNRNYLGGEGNKDLVKGFLWQEILEKTLTKFYFEDPRQIKYTFESYHKWKIYSPLGQL